MRRLFDGPDQGLDGEQWLLEPLPPPDPFPATCSLSWSLERAFSFGACPATRTELSVVTGSAFMLRVEPRFPLWSTVAGRDAYVVEAMTGLGRPAETRDEPDPPALLEAVRTEVQEGRPALALDWLGAPGIWSVLVGVQGTDLVGQAPGQRTRWTRARPELARLLIVHEPLAEVDPLLALLGTLKRAVVILEIAQPQWLRWRELLSVDDPYASDDDDPLSVWRAEQWLSECVLQGRDAAQQVLAQAAAEITELEPELSAAAEAAEAVVELLEGLIVSPEAVPIAHPEDDPILLEERLDRLELIRQREAAWIEDLRLCLTVAGDRE